MFLMALLTIKESYAIIGLTLNEQTDTYRTNLYYIRTDKC